MLDFPAASEFNNAANGIGNEVQASHDGRSKMSSKPAQCHQIALRRTSNRQDFRLFVIQFGNHSWLLKTHKTTLMLNNQVHVSPEACWELQFPTGRALENSHILLYVSICTMVSNVQYLICYICAYVETCNVIVIIKY